MIAVKLEFMYHSMLFGGVDSSFVYGFTALVAHGAAGFAGTLAGSLAFAAIAGVLVCVECLYVQGLYEFIFCHGCGLLSNMLCYVIIL